MKKILISGIATVLALVTTEKANAINNDASNDLLTEQSTPINLLGCDSDDEFDEMILIHLEWCDEIIS